MVEMQIRMSEIHNIGHATQERIVWPATCPLLAERHIRLAGLSDARRGFAFQRIDPDMGQILLCASGRGQVRVGDAWRTCAAGHAYLTPPHKPHAYRAITDHPWRLGWIMYRSTALNPLADLRAPALVRVTDTSLYAALRGLYAEQLGDGNASMTYHWVQLIHALAERIARSTDRGDTGFQAIWHEVDADLARPWTVDALAGLIHASGETLRRRCHQRFGCGVMQRVTQLRMERARALLSSTPRPLMEIAQAVGYTDVFAFSKAFKRWSGRVPSTYRHKRS